jgi:hypothetical protein
MFAKNTQQSMTRIRIATTLEALLFINMMLVKLPFCCHGFLDDVFVRKFHHQSLSAFPYHNQDMKVMKDDYLTVDGPPRKHQGRSILVQSKTRTFDLDLSNDRTLPVGTFTPSLKTKLRFWKRNKLQSNSSASQVIRFSYDYDLMMFNTSSTTDIIHGDAAGAPSTVNKTTGIVLIHPIGVGISKWYYRRLMRSFSWEVHRNSSPRVTQDQQLFIVIAPDLLGSGTACNATIVKANTHDRDDFQELLRFPLFNISDWTNQIIDLMTSFEQREGIDQWCIVANGGCSPIALQVASKSIHERKLNGNVSNVILSSVPRLSFFLQRGNDPIKVEKSYRKLCGFPGKLFWWYACRNNGSFIQTFSEKNLVSDPKSLGESWRSNCYDTATANNGKSKFSTFAFLAGTLQDGCVKSLQSLNGQPVFIDIIKGDDVRRNRARSLFWQNQQQQHRQRKSAKHVPNTTSDVNSENHYNTFRDYVRKNGNRGNEFEIGGRISLAHEDPDGYARAVMDCLTK